MVKHIEIPSSPTRCIQDECPACIAFAVCVPVDWRARALAAAIVEHADGTGSGYLIVNRHRGLWRVTVLGVTGVPEFADREEAQLAAERRGRQLVLDMMTWATAPGEQAKGGTL